MSDGTVRGRFITFEGPDGSGKSTQIRFLQRRLRQAGLKVIQTREPGGTVLGKHLRTLLLDARGMRLSPRAEAMLLSADRAQHVTRVIEPALTSGSIVVCDRYVDSTIAYQGYGSGLPVGELESLSEVATGGLMPDLTILIDVTTEIGLARRRASHRTQAGELNRLDRRDRAYHERVREGYLMIARMHRERVVLVDGTQPPEQVFARIWSSVVGLLSSPRAAGASISATQLPFSAQGAVMALPSQTRRSRSQDVPTPRDRRGRWTRPAPIDRDSGLFVQSGP